MDQPASDRPADRSSDALFAEAYAVLHGLAEAQFRRQDASHTLQPTALVHEAWLRLAASPAGAPAEREHLLALASRAMRQVLVDHARRRSADKRGGQDRHRVTLSAIDSGGGEWDVLDLNDALERLHGLDPRQAQIVEMRYFGGLTVEETAAALGISERSVYLDWQMARAWLSAELRSAE